MVDIIIPAYNAHKTIRQAIASVCAQNNINEIKLTIVDDFSDEPYDLIIDEYKNLLNIELLRKSVNEGCGQARQHGIDHTNAEYIMFLDADDCFYSTNSVEILYSIINNQNVDLVISNFLEEMDDGNCIVHKKDTVWMHGKIYRTEFIKSNDIRFNYTRCNEDHVFNALLEALKCKIINTDMITYVWKYNESSITKTAENDRTDSFNDYFINAEYCINEMQRLNIDSEIIMKVCAEYLKSMYGYYNLFNVNTSTNEQIFCCFTNIKKFYNNIPSDINKQLIINYVYQSVYSNNIINSIIYNNIPFVITLDDFIKLLK